MCSARYIIKLMLVPEDRTEYRSLAAAIKMVGNNDDDNHHDDKLF